MFKVRTARSGFNGTCGHPINPGDKFVVAEQRPKFHCSECGKQAMAKIYKTLADDLSSKETS